MLAACVRPCPHDISLKTGVDATFVLGGVTDSKQSPGLKSLGRVTHNPVWIFYRGTETVDRLPQFEGKRIGANFNTRLIRDLLALNGLSAETATLLQRTGPAAIRAHRSDADAGRDATCFSRRIGS